MPLGTIAIIRSFFRGHVEELAGVAKVRDKRHQQVPVACLAQVNVMHAVLCTCQSARAQVKGGIQTFLERGTT